MGDRVSKSAIREHLDNIGAIDIIPGWLRIIHVENSGAAFGVLAEGNPVLRGIILIGVAAAVL